MEAWSQQINPSEVTLKLLLFIDKRPNSDVQIRQIRQHLKHLQGTYPFQLDVVDVGEHPYLAEQFKLVATPALIKISPAPQQTLAGSTIVSQLERWWPRWQQEVEAQLSAQSPSQSKHNALSVNDSITHSANLLRLSDEIFRLNQLKEEFEAQLRFKDHIIAMMAHDLRNPLTAASIAIDTLELGYDRKGVKNAQLTPELTGQLLKHAKTQIRAIDRMITDILQAAHGASAELQIQPDAQDLNVLCLEALESMESKFQAKAHKVTTDIPEDLPRVYVDPGQVRRVIVNLLDNAIKYTAEGGQIDISALHRTTQKVQVSIHDTGPGIPKENRERIFEESFRLKRDQAKDGYGLGLALCQRIIRAHYGQIWVDSVCGEGSYFNFTLPVYKE